jgi:hypothetical protein
MKTIARTILALAITAAAAPSTLAAVSTADAVGACKQQAAAEFAQEGVSTRIKFRSTRRKSGATQVQLQVFPQGSDSFKATCMLNGKTGDVISLARVGGVNEALVQTAER